MNLGLGLQSIWVEVSVATGSLCFILPNGLGKKNIYYEAMLSMWWNILAFILVLNGKKYVKNHTDTTVRLFCLKQLLLGHTDLCNIFLEWDISGRRLN